MRVRLNPIPGVSLKEEETSKTLSTNGSSAVSVREFDMEMFIEEIRQLPCIWNTYLAAYKDQNKTNAWNKLSIMFDKGGNFTPIDFLLCGNYSFVPTGKQK